MDLQPLSFIRKPHSDWQTAKCSECEFWVKIEMRTIMLAPNSSSIGLCFGSPPKPAVLGIDPKTKQPNVVMLRSQTKQDEQACGVFFPKAI